MRYDRDAAADDWEMDEIVVRDGKRPCSDAYAAATDEELVQIFRELRLLRAAGVPPDRHRGNPIVQSWKGKCKGEHSRSEFFVLKAKPSGWRLYFFVPDRKQRRIVFLYSVNKKKNEHDQEDFQRLCNHRNKLFSGDSGVRTEPIEIPDR